MQWLCSRLRDPSRGDASVKSLRLPVDCHQVRSQWNRTRTISLPGSPPVKDLRISVHKPTQRSCRKGDVLIRLLVVTFWFPLLRFCPRNTQITLKQIKANESDRKARLLLSIQRSSLAHSLQPMAKREP